MRRIEMRCIGCAESSLAPCSVPSPRRSWPASKPSALHRFANEYGQLMSSDSTHAFASPNSRRARRFAGVRASIA